MTKNFSTAFFNNAVVISLVSVAASILLVGVVWAGSSALTGGQTATNAPRDLVPLGTGNNSTDTTTVSAQPSDPSGDNNYDEMIRVLNVRIDEATLQIESLSQDLSKLTQSSGDTRDDVAKITARLTDLASDVKNMKEELQETTKIVSGFDERLTSLASVVSKKTALINDDGKYAGSVSPSQISPQLRVTDVNGDWPLNRTTGDLTVSKLYFDGFSCSSDSRTHAVLTVDAFRRVGCVRIPK